MRHRLAEVEKRREGNDKVGKMLTAARAAVERFAEQFEDTRELRAKILKKLSRLTRRDNIQFDGLSASPTSPTPPTGASNIRSWC